MYKCQDCGQELAHLEPQAEHTAKVVLPKFEFGRCDQCKVYWIIRKVPYIEW